MTTLMKRKVASRHWDLGQAVKVNCWLNRPSSVLRCSLPLRVRKSRAENDKDASNINDTTTTAIKPNFLSRFYESELGVTIVC